MTTENKAKIARRWQVAICPNKWTRSNTSVNDKTITSEEESSISESQIQTTYLCHQQQMHGMRLGNIPRDLVVDNVSVIWQHSYLRSHQSLAFTTVLASTTSKRLPHICAKNWDCDYNWSLLPITLTIFWQWNFKSLTMVSHF